VSEYVLSTYPTDTHMLRVPIGPIPSEVTKEYGTWKGTRAFRPYRLEADAMVVTPKKLILIEGKVFRIRDGIGALATYRPLVPLTPELKVYLDRPLVCQLVTANPPRWLDQVAQVHDIEIVVFEPPWIADYVEHMNKYWTAEHRYGRLKRKQVLENLGFKDGA